MMSASKRASGEYRAPAPADPSLHASHEDTYWTSVQTAVMTALERGEYARLEWTPPARDLIDFGWAPQPADTQNRTMPSLLEGLRKDAGLWRLMLVHEHLEMTLDALLGRDGSAQTAFRCHDIEADLSQTRSHIEMLRENRTRFLEKRFDGPLRFRLEQINTTVEDSLWDAVALRHEMKRGPAGPPPDPSERQTRLVRTKARLAKAYLERNAVLESTGAGPVVQALNQQIEELYRKAFVLHQSLALAREKLERLQEEARHPRRTAARRGLRDELAHLRDAANRSAENAGVPPDPTLTNPARLPRPRDVAALFGALRPGPEGRPRLLLLPASGAGAYDADRHRFFVPTQPARPLDAAVAATLRDF